MTATAAPVKTGRGSLGADLTAGITVALVTIPDAMATAILAGVSPINGLYSLIQLFLGFIKAGGLVRYVSNAVLIGFMTGIALNIILGQLGDFTGYYSEYSNKVVKAIDLLFHLNQIDVQTTIIGFITIGLIFGKG